MSSNLLPTGPRLGTATTRAPLATADPACTLGFAGLTAERAGLTICATSARSIMKRTVFHTQYLWYGTIVSRGTQASLPPCVHVSLSMPGKEDNADKQIITLVCAGYTVYTNQMQLGEVESWCTAYKQGARSGCKITHVNGTRVLNWDAYTRLALGKRTFSMTLLYKSPDAHRKAVVRRKRMCFA